MFEDELNPKFPYESVSLQEQKNVASLVANRTFYTYGELTYRNALAISRDIFKVNEISSERLAAMAVQYPHMERSLWKS